MATVRAIVRAQKKSQAVIYFRLTDGRDLKIYYKSDLKVDPTLWDEKNQAIKVQKINTLTPEERAKFKKDIADLTDIIFKAYNSQPNKEIKTSDWLQDAVNCKFGLPRLKHVSFFRSQKQQLVSILRIFLRRKN